MRRFLVSVIVFLLVFVLTLGMSLCFGRFIMGNQYSNGYQASTIDKVARMREIDEPKIILAGNSNLSFGIDSKMIEEQLGMPVVNLGLHGGLGNAFHEEMAKLGVSEGDIVVYCPSEYSNMDAITDTALAWVTLEYNWDLWPILRLKDIPGMFKAYPSYLKDAYALWQSQDGNVVYQPYSRDSFNEYGDIAVRPGENTYVFTSVGIPVLDETFVKRVNKFNRYVEDKGAQLVIAGYPIGNGEFTPAAENYTEFSNQLAERMDCAVISDFADYMIPYDMFYDTYLHLNNEGVQLRTSQLVADLQAWMDGKTNL